MLREIQQIIRPPGLNMFLLTVIAVSQAFFMLVIVVMIFSRIPIHTGLEQALMPEWHEQLRPEREMFFYRFFVLAAVAVQAGLMFSLRKRIHDPELARPLWGFLWPDLLNTALILFALFKMAVYQPAEPGKYLFIAISIAALLWKILWWQIRDLLQKFARVLDHERVARLSIRCLDGLMPILIVLILFIPDVKGVVASAFSSDSFSHLDSLVMSTGWAVLKGLRIYVDVGSTYGIGLPMLVANLSWFAGGFNYETAMRILMILVCVYFILWYVFLRIWLRDVFLAAAGVILAVKFQMFGHGPNYFIWNTPSLTAVRFLPDVFLMFLILAHIRTRKRLFLWATMVWAGGAIFYLLDTGLYQLIAAYAYLFLCLIVPSCRSLVFQGRKDIIRIVALLLIPPAAIVILLWQAGGRAVLTPGFWRNATEVLRSFSASYAALPFYDNLKNGQYYHFFMSCLIPLVYLLAFLLTTGLLFFHVSRRENLMVAVLSVYGLGLFHFHVARSAASTFFTVAIPFVLVVMFGLRQVIDTAASVRRKSVYAFIFATSVFALVTTHSFLRYPGLLNSAGISFTEQKGTMRAGFFAAQDVALIQRWTSAEEKVCLISSFEIATLIAADRKPFFYYFRLVNSRRMNMRDFGKFMFSTKARFRKTMEQFQQERPRYVFIERKLFFGEIPEVYYQHIPSLAIIVTYLREHYQPVDQGKYLVALKRKVDLPVEPGEGP